MRPFISVIVPSYNHGPYIAGALRSVARQTLPASEILVVDDGSTDDSRAAIATVEDDRISHVFLDRNVGACEAVNIGLRRARGDFIALCNSDDAWRPDKLERQFEALSARDEVGAVFTDVDYMDERGEPMRNLPANMLDAFRPLAETRWGWIRELVENGNRLCHPSILARRAIYDWAGEYDNRLRQLPDLDMWLRVLQRFSVHVLDARLVRFRLHGGNTSAPSPSGSVRDRNEFAEIVERLFGTLDADNFHRAFGSIKEPRDPAWHLEVEKGLYLVAVGGRDGAIFNQVGTRMLSAALSSEAGREAWASYGFSIHDFHALRGLASPWLQRPAGAPLSEGEASFLERSSLRFAPPPESAPAAPAGPQGNPPAPLVPAPRVPIYRMGPRRIARGVLRRMRRGWYSATGRPPGLA